MQKWSFKNINLPFFSQTSATTLPLQFSLTDMLTP